MRRRVRPAALRHREAAELPVAARASELGAVGRRRRPLKLIAVGWLAHTLSRPRVGAHLQRARWGLEAALMASALSSHLPFLSWLRISEHRRDRRLCAQADAAFAGQ